MKISGTFILMGMTAGVACASIDFSQANAAFENRRWADSLGEYLKILEQDPGNIQARAYVNLIARQMDMERRSAQREERRFILEDAARRLENNRQDPSSLQQALTTSAQAEQFAGEERWRLLCEEARTKRENGQLLAANALVFQVLMENAAYPEAQRELSELQSALRQAIDGGKVLGISERFAYQGFYAYGQADYENALVAWRKVRTMNGNQITGLHFGPYEKLAEMKVEEQKRLVDLKRLFDQGIDLYQNNHFTEALDTFRRVAIRDPEFPLLGHHLVQAEAAAERERTKRLGERKRQELDLALQQGTDALAREKYTDAIQRFEQVLKLDPAHTQARSYLTMARSELQRQYDPKAAQARYEAGLVAYASGKLDESAREWRMTLRLDANHEKARIALNKVQKELAMTQQAP